MPKFGYVNVDDEGKAMLSRFNREFNELYEKIVNQTVPSREASLAITKLEEASMWLNKAIALHYQVFE